MDKYLKMVSGIAKEVEKILIENERSAGVHITIDVVVGEVPTINFDVERRLPEMECFYG